MIQRYMALLKAALMLSDGITAFLLFLGLVNIRFHLLDGTWLVEGLEPVQLGVVYALLWVGTLWMLGLYRLRSHWTLRGEAADVLRATLVAAVVSLAALYVLRLSDVSRLFVGMLWLSQPLVTIVSRAALRVVLSWMRSHGRLTRRMLVLGATDEAGRFADDVERHRELGLHVIGHLAGPRDAYPQLSRPILGTIDDIETVLHANVVDEVAICLSPQDWSYVEPATRICEEEGKIVRVSMQSLGSVLSGGSYEDLHGLPIVSFLYGPDRVVGMTLKRGFDIVASALLIIMLSPVMLLTALLIGLVDGGPVIFRHERIGLHGRPFGCLKFRTMVRGADEQQAEMEHLSDIEGPAFKMADDPRVTPLGRWLRRLSIDELPQLFNILRGEMSIVGPRPAPRSEVEGYSIWHRRRLSMRPGLTGLWQIQARGDNSFDRRAALDLYYIDGWSLWLDVKILLRTIPALVSQQGR
jgi:exopolysaccharide biosynthesis polyprenyl glycosylphosphotransferase